MKIYAAGMFVILFIVSFYNGYGLRANFSHSMPHTLYFSKPINQINRDDYVRVNHPQSKVALAKMIAGMPGDTIEVVNHAVLINGINKGAVLESSKSGQPYVAIQARIIPCEHYFVIGLHDESFDSRYAEFGLIHRDCIKENLCVIF